MDKQELVIGIIAQAGHGKDSCADILREEFGFARQALADPLKMDIYEAFKDFPEYSIEAQNSRDRDPRVRRLQQVYGTEWCRNRLGKDYWLRRWSEAAQGKFNGGVPGIAVPDLRFPNEVAYFKDEWEACILFVHRPGHEEPGVDPTHDSERFVRDLRSQADIEIVNDGTLDDLRRHVIDAVSLFLLKRQEDSVGDGVPPPMVDV